MGNMVNFGRPLDGAPTEGSGNLLSSGAVYAALQDVQDALVFDDEPEEGSGNPVTSDGIYNVAAGLLQAIAALEARIRALEGGGTSSAVEDGAAVVSGGISVEDGYIVDNGAAIEDGYLVL